MSFGKSIVFCALGGLAVCFVSCSNESENNGLQIPPSSSSSISSPSVEYDFSRAIAMNKKLGRGVNLGNAFDAQCRPGSLETGDCRYPLYPYASALETPGNGSWDGCWSNPIRDDYFEIIRASGFQSVRLPVRWAEKASDTPPFAIPAAFTASVKQVVDKAIAAGFPIILNIHHYNELYDDCKTRNDLALQKQKFVELWRQIANEFKDYSDDYLIFEILNEPRSRITSTSLNELLEQVWPIIRETNPNRTIMINSVDWGKYTTLVYIKIPNDDSNVILSGHYYNPHKFTHQGESNEYPATGVKWGSADEQEAIRQEIARVYNELKAKYAGIDGTTIPINIGEFGVTNKAGDPAQQGNWISFTRNEFEKYGFSWHYWAFPRAGGFDGYNYGSRTWIPEIIKALIPEEAQ